MKKRLLIFVCLVLVSCLAFLWLTAPPHRITKESFDRIKVGMTEKEVENILGVPAGNYEPATDKVRVYASSDLFIPVVPCEEKEWKGGGFTITIWFTNDEGKVFYSKMGGESSSPETYLDKLRHFLRLG